MACCVNWSYTVLSAVAFYLLALCSCSCSEVPVHLNKSDIFLRSHTAVFTVTDDTYARRVTGFSIDPKEYDDSGVGKIVRFGITAFHGVKGASSVNVILYLDQTDSSGNWKKHVCRAVIYGVDIVRDVAILAILCDTCNCKSLGALQTPILTVNAGETVLIIGDSVKGLFHSLEDGKLFKTDMAGCEACLTYKQINATDKTFFTRRHGLTGTVSHVDAGSPVLDISGKVVGMTLATSGDPRTCLTTAELLKAYEQRLKIPFVEYVGCTAHESAFLARTYWGGRSGKSILEMNSLARATNAQYFAVAHDEFSEAHAFTFHALWWEIFPEKDYMIEDDAQCLREGSCFTGCFLPMNGKFHCGCVDNSCGWNMHYLARHGEDNDRRWGIFKRRGVDKYYVPSDISLAMMENIDDETDYWRRKARELSKGKEDDESKCQRDKYTMNIVTAVLICLLVTLVLKFYYSKKEAENQLQQVARARDDIRMPVENLEL